MRSLTHVNFKFDATFFWYYPPTQNFFASAVKDNQTIAPEGIRH